MKKSLNKAAVILAPALTAVAVWWLSAHVLWLGDDLDYQFRMQGEIWQSWGFINNFTDFIDSQRVHYLHVNGRTIAHILVQLFCAVLGQQAFAVCNGVVYALFAVLLAKAGGVSRDNAGGMVSAVCLAVLCFVTKMMPTCQIGYIWGMAVNLAWLMAFFRLGKPGILKTLWMCAAGVIAGNWQEALSVGAGAGIGIWWLSQFFNRQATIHTFFDWRRSWMILGYLAGALSNVLSPANLTRLESVSMPHTYQWIITAYSVPALLLLIITILFIAARYRRSPSFSFDYANGIPTAVLWTGIIVLVCFNIYIGVFSNRQWFGVNMFASVLVLRLLPRHRFGTVVNSILIIAVAALWLVMWQGIREVKRQYDAIAALHADSPDGNVEYDRTRVMTLGHPLDAKYYEDILGQFDNDLHHSMMKDFKHKRKGKTLKLKPATSPDSEKVERYAPGHFYVTVKMPESGKPKRRVLVKGHYTLGGAINIEAEPSELTIEKYSRIRKPYATAVIIPEIPLFVADSVEIIP